MIIYYKPVTCCIILACLIQLTDPINAKKRHHKNKNRDSISGSNLNNCQRRPKEPFQSAYCRQSGFAYDSSSADKCIEISDGCPGEISVFRSYDDCMSSCPFKQYRPTPNPDYPPNYVTVEPNSTIKPDVQPGWRPRTTTRPYPDESSTTTRFPFMIPTNFPNDTSTRRPGPPFWPHPVVSSTTSQPPWLKPTSWPYDTTTRPIPTYRPDPYESSTTSLPTMTPPTKPISPITTIGPDLDYPPEPWPPVPLIGRESDPECTSDLEFWNDIILRAGVPRVKCTEYIIKYKPYAWRYNLRYDDCKPITHGCPESNNRNIFLSYEICRKKCLQPYRGEFGSDSNTQPEYYKPPREWDNLVAPEMHRIWRQGNQEEPTVSNPSLESGHTHSIDGYISRVSENPHYNPRRYQDDRR